MSSEQRAVCAMLLLGICHGINPFMRVQLRQNCTQHCGGSTQPDWDKASPQQTCLVLETGCLCGYRRRCEAPHLFLLFERLSAAGGAQPISAASPFLRVFISMYRLHYREKKLETCQSFQKFRKRKWDC